MNLQTINKEKTKLNPIEFIARLGVFGTFMGHGIVAIRVNPKWISLLTSFGFSGEQAVFLMPLIGILDIIVAIIILIYPIRVVLFWALFWTFLTALSRPISGESFLEFFERSSNWILPLVLLIVRYYPKKKGINENIFNTITQLYKNNNQIN